MELRRRNFAWTLPFALAFILGVGSGASAETNTELSAQDLSLQERAVKRLFPGGPDESDLEVRDGVTEAKQKVTRRDIERDVYKRLFKEEMKSGVEDEDSSREENPEED